MEANATSRSYASQTTLDSDSTGRFNCSVHPGTFVSHYCQEHDRVICPECRAHLHAKCQRVGRIAEVCEEIDQKQEIKNATERLQHMTRRINRLRIDVLDDLIALEKEEAACLRKLTDFRTELLKVFDTFEAPFKQTVHDVIAKEAATKSEQLRYLEGALAALDRDKSFFKDATSSHVSDKQHIFTATKTIDLQPLEEHVQAIEREKHMVKFEFQDGGLFQVLQERLKGLVEIIADAAPRLKYKSLVKIAARDVQQRQEKTCHITGATFAPDGEILLVDRANDCAKLLDRERWFLKHRVQLSSPPWDVAMVTAGDAVVSLPYEKKLQFIRLPLLTAEKKVSIGRRCFGLAVHGDRIFVSCHARSGDLEVLVLDKTATMIQRRLGWKPGTIDDFFWPYYIAPSTIDDFFWPYYIALDPRGERIYVSDFRRNKVMCFGQDGNHISTDTVTESPRQVLLDVAGNFLVCSCRSNTLDLVFAGGHIRKTLLNNTDGLVCPHTMAFRQTDNTLIIGMANSTVIVCRLV